MEYLRKRLINKWGARPPEYAMQSQHLVVILESVAFNRKMTCAEQTIDDMDQMHDAVNLLI